MMKRLVIAALCLSLSILAGKAEAKPWVMDAATSKLGFVGYEGKTPFQGGFKKFAVTIDFDAAHPENVKIDAIIDVTSAYAGSSERDEYLPQPDWFDYKTFPAATLSCAGMKKTGNDSYLASCFLALKGVKKTLDLPFTLTAEGDHSRVQGKVTLARNDFGVGIKEWANENYVKFAVDVTFDLNVKPAQ